MADKATAKEVSIDLAGFKLSVDKQFAGVAEQIRSLDKLLYWVIGLCVTIVGGVVAGGFQMNRDLGEVTSNGKLATAELNSIERRLGKLESRSEISANFDATRSIVITKSYELFSNYKIR